MTARATAGAASVLLLVLLAGSRADLKVRPYALSSAVPQPLVPSVRLQADREPPSVRLPFGEPQGRQPDRDRRGVRLEQVARVQPQPDPVPPGSDAEWNFDDEQEAVPTWAASIRTQALDLTAFAGFAALALVSFFRKSVRLKYLTLAVSVIYLGIYKSELISIVNIFGLLSWNLPIVRYSLGWYAFAVFTVASTVLWGRLYCGRICAFGALTQLLDAIVPARLRVNVPRAIERRAAYVKYAILGGAVTWYLVTRDISIYRYVEPFWMFTGQGTIAMWIAIALLLAATVFVRNLYCRFLCPVGAFLGLLSNLTVFRIKRWAECKTCRICEKTCEWGAIRGPRIVASECVRCDDCERLYMDQKKCPHWLIILRKSDIMARRSVAPTRSSVL